MSIPSQLKTVYVLPSIAGLRRWVDYIPVKAGTYTGRANSYNDEGYLTPNKITSTTGLRAWVDYTPVYEVTDPVAGRWRYNDTGWLPVTYSGAVFTPANLFAAGEGGFWYDPSDLSSMWQDFKFSVPAAVGSPVAFIADKAHTATAGSDIGGDFTVHWDGSVGAGCTKTGARTLSFDGTSTGTSGPPGRVANLPGVDLNSTFDTNGIGGIFEISVTVTNYVTGTAQIYVGLTPYTEITANGTYVLKGMADDGYFRIYTLTAGAKMDITLNYIKQFTGANHAAQVTSTKRPILRQDGAGHYYLEFDAVDDCLATPTSVTKSTDTGLTAFWGMSKHDPINGSYGMPWVWGDASGAQGNGRVLITPSTNGNYFAWLAGGTTTSYSDWTASGLGLTADASTLLTMELTYGATPSETVRKNGVSIGARVNQFGDSDTAVGGFLNNKSFTIGSTFAQNAYFADERMYYFVVRMAPTSSGDRASMEAYVNSIIGAY